MKKCPGMKRLLGDKDLGSKRIKSGEENTKYFHRVATTDKRFSTIDSLQIDGLGTTEPLTIKDSIWKSTRIYTGNNRRVEVKP